MGVNKEIISFKGLLPPALFSLLRKTRFYFNLQKKVNTIFRKERFVPIWNVIGKGLLKGKNIFVAAQGVWQEMLSGEYDISLINYLAEKDLTGKVIFDIGAHIGYSSMCFAQLVGQTGKVLAFEPNIFNRERFELIMSKNQELAKLITIYNFAVAEKVGTTEFIFNDNIDGGQSSGSFVLSSHTFFEKDLYERELGFRKVQVKTVALDLLESVGIKEKPFLIKIDVEGAEYLVLEGAKETLKKFKPILLLEIHSIYNMLQVGEILHSLNYQIKLLKEEKDGRCFIVAE